MSGDDEYNYGHGGRSDRGVGHPTDTDDGRQGLVKHLHNFSESKEFNIFIFGTICVAGISVGIQTDREMTGNTLLHVIDVLILLIFMFEAVIKILAQYPKPWMYFFDSWNVFDFTIVMIGLINLMAAGQGGDIIVVLRLFRLLRILKVVKFIPQLRIIVTTMFASLPSIGYISILLLLLFYIYGVLGVLLFEENDPRYFGDLGEAFLTLFRVMTCDSWAEILYINMNGCKHEYNSIDAKYCKHSKGFGLLAVCYFISFVIMISFIVLNLFIAVVTSNMSTASQEVSTENTKNDYTEAGLEPPRRPGFGTPQGVGPTVA